LEEDSEDVVTRRTALVVGLLLATMGGCAGLIGVQSLSGSDGGADAGSTDAGIDRAVSDGWPADRSSADVPSVDGPSCQPTWVAASGGVVPQGTVPDGPLDAGFIDYVCRVTTDGAVLPGKLLSPWGCYYANDDGGEMLSLNYEALLPTGCTAEWVPAPSGVTTSAALVCGQDEGGPLYSCQAAVQGTGATGNLGRMGWSTNHLCLYTLSGQALTTDTFDVLDMQ